MADALVAVTRHLIMNLPIQSSGFRFPFEFKATSHMGLPPPPETKIAARAARGAAPTMLRSRSPCQQFPRASTQAFA